MNAHIYQAALLWRFCPDKLEAKIRYRSGGVPMGDRDYRQRETKKPKKGGKPSKADALMPSADVAVVKKARKPRREEEGQSV